VEITANWLTDHAVLPFEIDTQHAFSTLVGRVADAFWLDGGLGGPQGSRYSFLGNADGPWSEVLEYRVGSGVVSARCPSGSCELAGTIFDVLESRLDERCAEPSDLPLPLTSGYVGYFGYEVKADCGSPNLYNSGQLDAAWIFADRLIAVDHVDKVSYLITSRPGGADPTPGRTWLSNTAAALSGGVEPPTGSADRPFTADIERWLVRDRATYLADIASCLEFLRAGDSYQICLTDTAVLPLDADPLDHYLAMRRRNLGYYSAFLRFGHLSIASSSPECFLRIDSAGVIESKPIKGTIARSADPDEDARRRAALVDDPKTRAENLMIVDLLRNDLGQVSDIGSVTVPHLMALESYANVHHLVSTIRGDKRSDVSSVRAVQQCFPAGSMTGAPKLRSMEILGRLEKRARGPYSGALGYLSTSGTTDLSVVIRTAVFDGSQLTVGAGGAIVLDSDPQDEFAEMLTKMATPLLGGPDG
jgi:para-aminobenzoate synthetase